MDAFPKRSLLSILLELFIDASLLCLFAVQALVAGCLLIYGSIPLPKDWVEARIVARNDSGWTLTADSFQLRLNGRIELDGVALHLEGFREPILRAEETIARFSLRKDGAFQTNLTDLAVANGTFYLPAAYAPDGKRTAVLERIALHLTPHSERILIESFAAKHEDFHLRGSIDWPLTTDRPPMDPVADTPPFTELFETLAAALKHKPLLTPFAEPTLAFKVTGLDDGAVEIATQLSSPELNHPLATGTQFLAETTVRLANKEVFSESPLTVRAETFQLSEQSITATGVHARIAQTHWNALLEKKWPTLEVTAQTLSINKMELKGPNLTLDPLGFPENIQFTGTTGGLKDAVEFAGFLNAADHSGHIEARGNVDLLSLVPAEFLPNMPELFFQSAPYYDLSVRLGPDYKIDSAHFTVTTRDLMVGGLIFDSLNASGSFSDGVFTLDNLFIDRGPQQQIDLQFRFDSRLSDYRIGIRGFAIPNQYNALLPRWWAAIFEDFEFSPQSEGYGDFVISGNTQSDNADLFYGQAQARNFRFTGVELDRADVRVRGRGRYVAVDQINAEGESGWARGAIRFISKDDDVPEPLSTRFNFDAELPLEIAEKIFGENVAAVLADFETEQLPRIQLEGAHFSEAYPEFAGLGYIQLSADSGGPVRYKDVPLDHLSFNLHGRDSVTYLRNVRFGYASGSGNGAIDILTPDSATSELRLQLALKDADQTLALKNLPGAEPTAPEQTPAAAANPRPTLDLQLHARGPAADPYQFFGYGRFRVLNEALGAVQLLGPLSTWLKDTPLNFTSFNLNRMESDFEIRGETLRFNELQVTGPRTKITGEGTLQLDDQALEMRINVDLFGNMGDPLSRLRAVKDVLTSPLPLLLDFELSGTLDAPIWRSTFDPRNFFRKL